MMRIMSEKDLQPYEMSEEIDHEIAPESNPDSWEDIVDEEITDMDTGYLDTEYVNNAGYGDLLGALGYLDEAVEGREVDIEIDEYTTDQLKWGSLDGPVVLNLEMDAIDLLDNIDDSSLTYNGKFVEVDHEPPIVLGFGTYEGNSDHQPRFSTENLRISAPNSHHYSKFE
jgi:hypothetical protein